MSISDAFGLNGNAEKIIQNAKKEVIICTNADEIKSKIKLSKSFS